MSINYAAIIMDIRHSRKYDEEQRFFIQDKLFSIIQFINKYYNKELVKKLTNYVEKNWEMRYNTN